MSNYRTLQDIEYDIWSAKRLGAIELEAVFREELSAWWNQPRREMPDTSAAQAYIIELRRPR